MGRLAENLVQPALVAALYSLLLQGFARRLTRRVPSLVGQSDPRRQRAEVDITCSPFFHDIVLKAADSGRIRCKRVPRCICM